jgi:hypothetical protein
MTKENDNRRKCWHCEDGILIWGGDNDADNDEHLIVTNLSCGECGAYYEIWWGKTNDE